MFYKRFLLANYDFEDFRALQTNLNTLTALIKYHLPKIYNVLFENDISTEIFAAKWMLTLLLTTMPLPIALYYVEFLIIEDDPQLIFYLSLAVLSMKEQQILTSSPFNLPVLLTSVQIENVNDL